MTVRVWFRVQRGEFWRRDPGAAGDIDQVAVACVEDRPLPTRWVRVGSVGWVWSVREYVERERVLALVRADMDRAMRQLMAKGLTD